MVSRADTDALWLALNALTARVQRLEADKPAKAAEIAEVRKLAIKAAGDVEAMKPVRGGGDPPEGWEPESRDLTGLTYEVRRGG